MLLIEVDVLIGNRSELQEFIGQVNIGIDEHINKPINYKMADDEGDEFL